MRGEYRQGSQHTLYYIIQVSLAPGCLYVRGRGQEACGPTLGIYKPVSQVSPTLDPETATVTRHASPHRHTHKTIIRCYHWPDSPGGRGCMSDVLGMVCLRPHTSCVYVEGRIRSVHVVVLQWAIMVKQIESAVSIARGCVLIGRGAVCTQSVLG